MDSTDLSYQDKVLKRLEAIREREERAKDVQTHYLNFLLLQVKVPLSWGIAQADSWMISKGYRLSEYHDRIGIPLEDDGYYVYLQTDYVSSIINRCELTLENGVILVGRNASVKSI